MDKHKQDGAGGLNPAMRWFLIGFCSLLAIAGSMYVGGYMSCAEGGGVLDGKACVGMGEIDVCEFEGSLYKRPVPSVVDYNVTV